MHTWRTLAFSVLRITFAVILALAFLFTFLTVFAVRTRLRAQWASETGGARTLATHMMTFTAVFAATRLRAIETVLAVRTLQFALVASVSFRALAQTVKLIADAVVLALASMRATSAPHASWTFCTKIIEFS